MTKTKPPFPAEVRDRAVRMVLDHQGEHATQWATICSIAATAVGRTEAALSAFYRRLSARLGKAKAVTATARKIAILFYNTLHYGMAYVDPGVSYYEGLYKRRVLTSLDQRAKSLGCVLQQAPVLS